MQIINWRRNKHTSDTVIFGLMSLEKPNVGKLVQLSEGFIINSEYNLGARNGSPSRECPQK